MTDEHLAKLLLAARQGALVPTGLAPADEAQAYRVQALVMAELGEIGGWKVGAPGPDGPISCAPMPRSGISQAPTRFDPAVFTQRDVESEICFKMCANLTPREAPYGRAEVMAAIATLPSRASRCCSRATRTRTPCRRRWRLLADFIHDRRLRRGQRRSRAGATSISRPLPITPGDRRRRGASHADRQPGRRHDAADGVAGQ